MLFDKTMDKPPPFSSWLSLEDSVEYKTQPSITRMFDSLKRYPVMEGVDMKARVGAKTLWVGRVYDNDFGRSPLSLLIGFVTEDEWVPRETLFPRPVPNRITMMINQLALRDAFGPALSTMRVSARNVVNFNHLENRRRKLDGDFTPKGLLIQFGDELDLDYLEQHMENFIATLVRHINNDWRYNGEQLNPKLCRARRNTRCFHYAPSDSRGSLRHWLDGESIARFYPSTSNFDDLSTYTVWMYRWRHKEHMEFIIACWGMDTRNCTWNDFKRFATPIEYFAPEFIIYKDALEEIQSWMLLDFKEVITATERAVCYAREDGMTIDDACDLVWNQHCALS